MSIKNYEITAVILAGGQSKRMSGQDKGLIQLNKKPLIQSVIEVLADEVASILINANRNQKYYQKFTKLPVISDATTDFLGPLSGFAAAMSVAKTPYLLVLPCDCPMIGKALFSGLKQGFTGDTQISIAHDGKRLQPTFVLLKVDLLPSLLQYLKQGNRKIDLWYQQHQTKIVDFSDKKHFFINLNSPIDYALFTQADKIKNIPILGFSAFSGTGKTTLMIKLISNLSQYKIRIAYLKHAHHNFEIDHHGKDSYECYHAGAQQVLISSSKRFALINRYQQELNLFALVKKLDLKNIDLILVEGFKNENFKKIELQRSELQCPSLFTDDINVFAVASDTTDMWCNRVVLDINNVEQISGFIQAYIKDVAITPTI